MTYPLAEADVTEVVEALGVFAEMCSDATEPEEAALARDLRDRVTGGLRALGIEDTDLVLRVLGFTIEIWAPGVGRWANEEDNAENIAHMVSALSLRNRISMFFGDALRLDPVAI